MQHRGSLGVLTSIAPCGRHFKGTSSLKNPGLDFHVQQNLYARLSLFYVVRSLTRSGCEETPVFFLAQQNVGLPMLCAFSVPEDFPFCRLPFSGVVPESQSQMEKERAFWPDAAGPDALFERVRAPYPDPA